ncbi:aminoglycoside N(3)-acetyltransferase [Tengunoibacter tsumagoiensis]|uniref:Aminoglycoside N(3)-acetyltransferase n=1 Tax=Tengunoibacter tsumagoiensis TaxID=2014871 RepID=A0A402A6D9_9CHLR|nr:AAC(3) family N-acetyltransferase [Tengunoibacter tsumagoiensis]GCE14700.1 AAC(3) family N-acetyltransferase [Tengunoibacter tsumagoiensis]
MTEKEVIQNTPVPRTRESLAIDLRTLGLQAGMIVIIHSSLRSIGWTCGGPVAVVQALMDVITEEGTIVMPTQTGNYSDPAQWQNPPVPPEWLPTLYEAMPAFNPLTTPSYKMGQIVEAFRTWPGVVRSNHPLVSFAAWGRHASEIVERQSLEYGLGEASPLARMYDLSGWVLLLGVDYDRDTSLHLAEYRTPGAKEVLLGSPMLENGQRVWKQYRDIEIDSDVFPQLGVELERLQLVRVGKVGSATAKLHPQRTAIDVAVDWYKQQRMTV